MTAHLFWLGATLLAILAIAFLFFWLLVRRFSFPRYPPPLYSAKKKQPKRKFKKRPEQKPEDQDSYDYCDMSTNRRSPEIELDQYEVYKENRRKRAVQYWLEDTPEVPREILVDNVHFNSFHSDWSRRARTCYSP